MKPNCYECKYRGDLWGDAHSCCVHPLAGGANGVIGMATMLGALPNRLNIQGNKHGIKNGWFAWPVNFDPIWLESCDGFIRKEEQHEQQNTLVPESGVNSVRSIESDCGKGCITETTTTSK